MLSALTEKRAQDSVADLRERMQTSMDENAGVFRTDDLLREQSSILDELQGRYARGAAVQDTSKRYNTDLLEAVELGFLLDLAQTLVLCARNRTESRGGHARDDYPGRDDVNWLKHSLIWKTNGDHKIDYKPVTITRYQPTERKY
jgi:succinate dehydrogenase / fumarate reductase flavoprotein subunit